MRTSLAILLVGLLGGTASAQQGFPLTLDVVHQILPEKGIVAVRHVVMVQEIKEIAEKIVVNGQERTVVKKVVVPVAVEKMIEFDLAKSRVMATNGKQVANGEVWKRLKVGAAVAVSSDANPPAPAFLRALHPDLLVILPYQPNRPKSMPLPK